MRLPAATPRGAGEGDGQAEIGEYLGHAFEGHLGPGSVGLRPAVMLYQVLFLADSCANRSVVTGGSCLPGPLVDC